MAYPMFVRVFKEKELTGYGFDVNNGVVCSFKKGKGPLPMAHKTSYMLNGKRYSHIQLRSKIIPVF